MAYTKTQNKPKPKLKPTAHCKNSCVDITVHNCNTEHSTEQL